MRAGSAMSAEGEGAGKPQFLINDVLSQARQRDLVNLYNYWEGGLNGGPPEDEELMRNRIHS